jgi:hypothetical protein
MIRMLVVLYVDVAHSSQTSHVSLDLHDCSVSRICFMMIECMMSNLLKYARYSNAISSNATDFYLPMRTNFCSFPTP